MDKELEVKRFVAQEYCKKEDYERGLALYREIFNREKKEEDIKKFIDFSLKYASTFSASRNWLKVLDVYSYLLSKSSIVVKCDSLYLCTRISYIIASIFYWSEYYPVSWG